MKHCIKTVVAPAERNCGSIEEHGVESGNLFIVLAFGSNLVLNNLAA